MLRKSTTFVPALVLGLLLAAVPASAAPLGGDLLGSVRGAFASIWQRLSAVVWGWGGVEIDPAGQPAQAPKAVWGEFGMGTDPNGQPTQAPAPPPGEFGMGSDPNG